MSSIARPSGQLPPGVYWRRRIVLIVVIALIIFGITKLFGGGGGDKDPPKATPTAGATTTAPPRATKTTPTQSVPTTKAPKKRSKREVEIAVSLPAAAGVCDPSEVQAKPAVTGGTYAAGSVPIHLAFSTTSAKPCTLRVESPKLIIAVANSDKTLWESKACGAIPARSIELQPTWATTVDVVWNGRKSGASCNKPGSFVPVGSYTVKAAMLGGEPANSAFTLAQRPAPPASPKPNPKTTGPKKPKKH